MNTSTCRDCKHEVSNQAFQCPHCGAPYPYKAEWDGYGFEWKTKTQLFGLPLIHICFKYRPSLRPKFAKGVIAIGQFSTELINISQFGFGPICVSQFALAIYAVAQFTAACYAVCQYGIVIEGIGQTILRLADLL